MYDIMFRLHALLHDQERLEGVSDGFTDYLLNAGHDMLVSFDGVKDEIVIELIDFEGDDEPDALRIAMELLDSAAVHIGVNIIWDHPKPKWHGFGRHESPAGTALKKLQTSIQS